jgi:hypothetical protein
MPKSPRSSPNLIRVIDVITYPAVQLLDVTGPVQVFASANDVVVNTGGTPSYLLKVVAKGGKGAIASAEVTRPQGSASPSQGNGRGDRALRDGSRHLENRSALSRGA